MLRNRDKLMFDVILCQKINIFSSFFAKILSPFLGYFEVALFSKSGLSFLKLSKISRAPRHLNCHYIHRTGWRSWGSCSRLGFGKRSARMTCWKITRKCTTTCFNFPVQPTRTHLCSAATTQQPRRKSLSERSGPSSPRSAPMSYSSTSSDFDSDSTSFDFDSDSTSFNFDSDSTFFYFVSDSPFFKFDSDSTSFNFDSDSTFFYFDSGSTSFSFDYDSTSFDFDSDSTFFYFDSDWTSF